MHRNRQVYRADSRPEQPHNELGIEVESPRRSDRFHDADGGFERVKPKAEKRIVDSAPEGFKVGEPVPDAPSLYSLRRSIWSEDRHTENHRFGMPG